MWALTKIRFHSGYAMGPNPSPSQPGFVGAKLAPFKCRMACCGINCAAVWGGSPRVAYVGQGI